MKIKDRIAAYFTLITTAILLAVLITVYVTFRQFLQADFFERLTDRTMVTAKLYLEADEISRDALNTVRHLYLQKLKGEVIRIYNHNNQATFISDSTQYWTSSIIEKVRKEGSLKYVDGDRQVVGIYYKDNQGDFVILASATDQGSHNRLSKLLSIMTFVFVLISCLVLMLSRAIARKMLLPLQNLTNEVGQIDSGKMHSRVKDSHNHDEIHQIAKSFNHLMEELEQAFILQKTFVANASHELRTPLTRILMTTELALSRPREPQTYQEVISSVIEETEKMEHMINGLLALAKMDMAVIGSPLTKMDMIPFLQKMQQEWITSRKLPLELILKTNQPCMVMGNALLLQIALDNVIANAFKFSKEQDVICQLQENEGWVQIQVSDLGPGIEPAMEQEIFKPFYTRAENFGLEGNGMGLYMARKIVSAFHGNIHILHEENTSGATFLIQLPRL